MPPSQQSAASGPRFSSPPTTWSRRHDPEGQARFAAFAQGLQQLGWTGGRNVRFDIRSTAGNVDDARKYAAELVALAPRRSGAGLRKRYPIRYPIFEISL